MTTLTPTLAELIEQLHEVDTELSEAARPLNHLPELNLQQRNELGDKIRASLRRWEGITRQIREVMMQQ